MCNSTIATPEKTCREAWWLASGDVVYRWTAITSDSLRVEISYRIQVELDEVGGGGVLTLTWLLTCNRPKLIWVLIKRDFRR